MDDAAATKNSFRHLNGNAHTHTHDETHTHAHHKHTHTHSKADYTSKPSLNSALTERSSRVVVEDRKLVLKLGLSGEEGEGYPYPPL